jgi:cell wall-associated NlpC family hydrolase
MTPPAWCAEFVGKDYADKGRGPDAFDCWGIVRHIMACRYGRDLPDYADAYTNGKDRESVATAVRAGLAIRWQKVEIPSEGDLIILRLAGHPWHCAISIGGDWMLHAQEGAGVIAEQFTRPIWNKRIEGFYRYAE